MAKLGATGTGQEHPAGDEKSFPSLSAILDTADGEEADAADVLTKGTSLGRYLVLDRMGVGAMGVVSSRRRKREAPSGPIPLV